ncbi:hypothetical protein FZC79_04175 [Rossellomorea vietnamensis]|uniref:Uncharacterized protein n=1 Tax=Rossellomorea vietnamensis TaxID=218284 RepID=A0A5D4KI32_9BACI|nr:hypothetical protein [Rossellomorea vietnamensis]TYR76901.1 hypothetical protein FZC79_04175 [Rossellomorea vietnamensis]
MIDERFEFTLAIELSRFRPGNSSSRPLTVKKQISMARKSRFRAVIRTKSESQWPANPVSGPLSVQKVNLNGPQIPFPGRYPYKKQISIARKSRFRAVIRTKSKSQRPANTVTGPLSVQKANLNGPQIRLPGRYPSKKQISMARKSRFRAVIRTKSKSQWPVNPVSGPLSVQKANLNGQQIRLPGRYPSKKQISMARKSRFRAVIRTKSKSQWPVNPAPGPLTIKKMNLNVPQISS